MTRLIARFKPSCLHSPAILVGLCMSLGGQTVFAMIDQQVTAYVGSMPNDSIWVYTLLGEVLSERFSAVLLSDSIFMETVRRVS